LTRTNPSATLTSTWDARNRVTGLRAFAYDGLGRRAQKTVNSVLTQFRYDGLDAVRERRGGNDVTSLRTLGLDATLARTDAAETVPYLAVIRDAAKNR
jgi:hypothetical protein